MSWGYHITFSLMPQWQFDIIRNIPYPMLAVLSFINNKIHGHTKRRSNMLYPYRSFQERTPDSQYARLLERILSEGDSVMPQQEEEAKMVFGHQMRFPFADGFPIVTERDLVGADEGQHSQFHMA